MTDAISNTSGGTVSLPPAGRPMGPMPLAVDPFYAAHAASVSEEYRARVRPSGEYDWDGIPDGLTLEDYAPQSP